MATALLIFRLLKERQPRWPPANRAATVLLGTVSAGHDRTHGSMIDGGGGARNRRLRRGAGSREIDEVFGSGSRGHVGLRARHPVGRRRAALQPDFAQTSGAQRLLARCAAARPARSIRREGAFGPQGRARRPSWSDAKNASDSDFNDLAKHHLHHRPSDSHDDDQDNQPKSDRHCQRHKFLNRPGEQLPRGT
jgi:hypothetical protein